MTASNSTPSRSALSVRAIPWAVAAVTFLVFLPALQNGFVEWDDNVNLYENPRFRGLGWTQLRWMFTTTLMGHYIPLTWLSFGIDYVIWGLNPLGYHLTSLLLHIANAALAYAVALRLLGKASPDTPPLPLRAGAALAALFFALHPLRAESVAWATERRDVLSGLLFLAAALLYVTAVEAGGGPRRRLLAGSVGCFFLALFAKSIVMTFPLLLVLLDLYPLRRLGWRPRGWLSPAERQVWREKAPFFVVALLGALVSWWAVAVNNFFTSWDKYPVPARVAMALYSSFFYVAKTALPLSLSPLYELPARVDPLEGRFVGSALAVVAITVALGLLARRWPAALAAWAWYLIVLLPVNGIVHAGYQLAHDRYSYLSCLGFALLLGGVPGVLARAAERGVTRPALARGAGAVLGAWLGALGLLTWHQTQIWRSTETLWSHAAEVQPDCAICHDNLGAVLVNQGYANASMPHFYRALALRPDLKNAEGSLGLALMEIGRPEEAVPRLRRALEKHPDRAGFHNNLGTALLRLQRYEEALGPLRRAVEIKPEEVRSRATLGMALAGLGRMDEALEEYRRAIAIKPDAPEPRVGLAMAYLTLGDLGAAREQYEVARRLSPTLAAPLAPSFTSGL